MEPRRWEEIRAAFDELVELDEASRASRPTALGARSRATPGGRPAPEGSNK